MRIKKVFNSSVVLATGSDDAELILLGKGIGYGQRPGDIVPEGATDRFFVPVRNPVAKELLQLLDSIEPEYLDLAREIIVYAEQMLGTTCTSISTSRSPITCTSRSNGRTPACRW